MFGKLVAWVRLIVGYLVFWGTLVGGWILWLDCWCCIVVCFYCILWDCVNSVGICLMLFLYICLVVCLLFGFVLICSVVL